MVNRTKQTLALFDAVDLQFGLQLGRDGNFVMLEADFNHPDIPNTSILLKKDEAIEVARLLLNQAYALG